jgi:hypothetical protein
MTARRSHFGRLRRFVLRLWALREYRPFSEPCRRHFAAGDSVIEPRSAFERLRFGVSVVVQIVHMIDPTPTVFDAVLTDAGF